MRVGAIPPTIRERPDDPAATRTYLDANASEPIRPEARAAAIASLALTGNSASVHGSGRASRRLLEDSRERIAALAATTPDRIVLTSGGTEANAIAVHGLGAGRRLLVGATEHAAILDAAGADAERLPVRDDGTLDLDRLEAALDASPVPALVCVMAANNETGVLHPLDAVLAACRRRGALLHVDAVQIPGRMPLASTVPAADGIALSAHKQGGLPGAGALVLGREATLGRILMPGGGQEYGRRGGTPNLAAIAAFAAVAPIAPPTHLARLRDRIERDCVAAGAIAIGADAPRLPNTLCLALPGRGAASQLIALDLAGFEVSAGAACSSGRIGGSHVLEAMRAGALSGQSIRVSLPWNATEDQAARFVEAWRAMAGGQAAQAVAAR